MSLVYVIDGYNVIKHPSFAQAISFHRYASRAGFLQLLFSRRLTGSSKNRVIVVFDGYPDAGGGDSMDSIDVVFSRDETADDRIRQLLEHTVAARTCIVVSDDREIRMFARMAGAQTIGVEEFIGRGKKNSVVSARQRQEKEDSKLNYSQMEKINKELREKWLK
jgi:predicted RNA-binding protein with PIN domain